MVETAAHLVDQVLPRVPYRQWVLSVPKRVRWHMQRKPEVTSALLRIFLRAVEPRLRQRSPDAPGSARFGAVAFDPGDDVLAVQKQMRHRGLRWLLCHGHPDAAAIHILDTPEHAGGWSVDASVNLPAWDRQGLERLGWLNDQTLVYRLRKPVIESAGPAGATLQLLQEAQRKLGLQDVDQEDTEPCSRASRLAARCWALLLVRIYECLPLFCPSCNGPMRILAFIQDPPVIEKSLRHIGEPT